MGFGHHTGTYTLLKTVFFASKRHNTHILKRLGASEKQWLVHPYLSTTTTTAAITTATTTTTAAAAATTTTTAAAAAAAAAATTTTITTKYNIGIISSMCLKQSIN